MVDVGTFLPAVIARAAQQSAMTPQQALRQGVLHRCRTRGRLAFDQPLTQMSDDIRARAPLLVGERLHLGDDILRSEAVEFQIVAQLGRSAAPGYGVEPAELVARAGVDRPTEIAGFEQQVLFEQAVDRLVRDSRQPRGGGEKGGSRHLGLDRTQPVEQVQYRLWLGAVDRRELPPEGATAKLVSGELAHAGNATYGGLRSQPCRKWRVVKTWLRYSELMHRVALLT